MDQIEFGKKEHVLNYACQLYQLSRPTKVGAVMALIRECQPSSYEEWKEWYFANAYTATKTPVKLSLESLTELGERLYFAAGSDKNIKLTTKDDLEMFKAYLKSDKENWLK